MTKSQILKILKSSGFDMENIVSVSKDEIEIGAGGDESQFDRKKTDKAIKAMRDAGLLWGGYYTGYNSFVARNNYKSLGEWNDTASAHHY